MLTGRQKREERRMRGRNREASWTKQDKNRLWRPDYRKLNTSLPTDNKGQGEATPTHLAQHHLSKAPFNRSNTINGFPTRVQTKRFLEWDNQEWKKKPPPQIQTDILCGPVRILYRKSWRGPTLSLHKAALHNQSLWVMTHGLLPQLLPFLSFSFSDSLIPTGYIREKNIVVFFRDFRCLHISLS